jgi:hypothetical protein
MNNVLDIDKDFFEAHQTRTEYVRDPLPGEFAEVDIPANAFVRVFRINQRALVKALETPTGERVATVMQSMTDTTGTRKAA